MGIMGKTAKYQTGGDRSLLTVFGRPSEDFDEEETTSLLGSQKHHLTQPRRRRGSSSEMKAAMSSWTFEHTFGYSAEDLEEDVVKKPMEPMEPEIVLDAGWNLANVVTIVMCKGDRCLENHPLLPSNMWEFEHGAVCSMCNKDVGFDGGLMSCRDCNWDICPDCNELRKI